MISDVLPMRLYNDILTSGHIFSSHERDIQFKYALTNFIIIATVIPIFFLTLFWLADHRYLLSLVNGIYIVVGVILFIYLRKDKKAQYVSSIVLLITSYIVLTVAIWLNPDEYMRVGWFLVIESFSFFLNGRRIGYAITVLSIVTIGILFFFSPIEMNAHSLALIVLFLILNALLIEMYERREHRIKQELYHTNKYLEERVRREIKKRLEMYEKSNAELKAVAEELEQQKNSYQKLAHYDALTNLPNRVLFFDRLNQAIKRKKRHHGKLAVLFMDLDNFKEINDSLGHQAGDAVLKELGRRLKEQIRQSDTLARFGGDEFILLMEDFENTTAIAITAQKLTRILSEPLTVKGRELYLSVSIGVALYPDDGIEAQELLKCADSAMYSAKKEGFNLVHFYKEEMTKKSLEKLTIDTYIRRAIDNDEYELYYQPQVDAVTQKIVGVETLVRWHHPQKGLILPGEFIPIAEESSLIVHLGELILRKAAEQMAVWQRKGIAPEFLSVNISTVQLRRHDIVETIQTIVQKVCRRNTWLELEITESFTLENPKQAIALLTKIRQMGIHLSIDDFGTGCSSLSYLKNLPVNKLKIDRSFVQDIPGSPEDEALIHAIVAMAQGLGVKVVAEGVETQQQKDFLVAAGCTIVQGYYFSQPVPAQEMETLLLHNQTGEMHGSTFS
jgi:diguanylate cyclase (GGDEF)-like protein